MIIDLLLYGICFDQDLQINLPVPDKVTETFPEFVALAAAVTVKVLSSAVVATTKEPSTAEPDV